MLRPVARYGNPAGVVGGHQDLLTGTHHSPPAVGHFITPTGLPAWCARWWPGLGRSDEQLRKVHTVGSPQTLSEADRRLVAAWAADCAERVLGLFEAEAPADERPRAAIARTRAFARGELRTAEEIRRRFVGGVAAGEVKAPAAAAAARSAGQAVAICHMRAHALGAAAYAVKATALAAPDRPEAVKDEIRWQLSHMSIEVRAALRALPPVGENRSGPLGPGLLASGELGTIIRDLQAGLVLPDPD